MTDKSNKAADAKLEELHAEVERLTKALAEAQKTMTDGVEESTETLRETAGEMAGELNERAQEGISELQKQIAENPVQSALVAFGLGFILSRLLPR